MSKSRKSKTHTPPSASTLPNQRVRRRGFIILATAALAAGSLWWVKTGQPDRSAPVVATIATNTALSASGSSPNPSFEKLKGDWRRPDGGYVLEIRGVEPGGRLDAAYFNPKPIKVSKAVALQDGAATKVFVELRDINYPGSTYTLAYQAESDQLAGIYYQAALQQQFEVVFGRIK